MPMPGRSHAPTAACAASHHDESLGLEHAEGVADGGAGHVERRHQRALWRQQLVGLVLAGDDAPAQGVGHELGRLGDADGGVLLAHCVLTG
jgi:hypothetical protein